MEESATAASSPTGTVEELAIEGQKLVEATVNSAQDILSTLDESLTTSVGWAGPGRSAPSSTSGPGSDCSGPGVEPLLFGSVETVRSQYKASSAALRSVVTAITTASQLRQGERENGGEKADAVDLDELEQRAAELREDVVRKNRVLKLLINKTRELISDLSLWQTTNM